MKIKYFSKKFNKKIAVIASVAVLLLGLFLYFGYVYLILKKGSWDYLKNQANAEASIHRGETGSPRIITGDFSGYEKKQDAKSAAWAFIVDNKAIYGIKNPEKEVFFQSESDVEEIFKEEFIQKYNDVPVFGAQILVRVKKDLIIESVFSTYVPNINLDTKPKISKEEAANKAGYGGASAELVIYSPATQDKTGENRLAWLVKGDGEDIFIDAENGEMLNSYATRYQALNRETYNSNFSQNVNGTLVMNENGAVAGLPAGQPDAAAKNAHASTGTAYGYFNSRLNRDSYDGAGADMVTNVNYRDNPLVVFNNAFWWSEIDEVTVGDGWSTAPVDIIGHEWTHGVTAHTANLVYSGQSGALNESYSDIFGAFAEFYSGTKNWTVGEGLPNGAIRDMKNPNLFNDPDELTDANFVAIGPKCNQNNDYCGVHTNSAILNKVAQLLVDGGEHNGKIITPVGVEKTERLFYRVLSAKLGINSNFNDTRFETIDLAKKGFTVKATGTKYTYSKKEKAAIINAFAAVGIGAEDANYDGKPDNTDPPNPKNGIAIIDIQAGPKVFNTGACGEPNKFEVYALTKLYGNAKYDYSYLQYKFKKSGDWKSVGDSKTEKVKYPEAGELGKLDWYKYTIKDLTEESDQELSYRLHFIIKDNVLFGTETFGGIGVKSCPNQKTMNILMNIDPNALNNMSQNIQGGNIIPINPDILKQEKTLSKTLDSSASGYVSANGTSSAKGEPFAGELNGGTKALLTYDVSDIAYRKTVNISSAKINLAAATKIGNPFSLGQLKIYGCVYGMPDAPDYSARCSLLTSISDIPRGGQVDITDYVKINYKSGKIQLRLEFTQTSNGDRTIDKLNFPEDKIILDIKYTG